ncbi:hypothetical protein Ssed_3631 [Shewanella sediminis HAW-EB3]|uniref:Uncharacterized protein n=1 Tax=Shewanella sediminis (strain HAW-EB3) TaxID=425104 RepID=A8FZG2_SHESH|nr:leucine-rich repeat domain-containing protein [Shewanella sediminis]ABV38235.1 hypothetical protein Ssed_3631 [Shewanella sediminis HAW-EB3]
MKSSKLTIGLLSTSLLALSGCSLIQGPKLVSELEFNDPQFAHCVMQNGQEALAQITELNCNNLQVGAVDEIRYMPALTDLILLDNDISAIDVGSQPNLKRLIIAGNRLTDIDLTKNPELTSLNISGNRLTHLDLSGNPKLKSLYAYKMPIAEIDLSLQSKLRDLGLSRHKLTGIDLSRNPQLQSLNLSVGTLPQINLSHNPKLSHLYLSGNKLTQLDLGANPNLKLLSVRNNQLTSLNLKGKLQLSQLKADYNQISDIDFGSNSALKEVELNNNQLTSLDISNQTQLEKLTAFNNPLQSLKKNDEHEVALLSLEGTPYAISKKELESEQNDDSDISNLLSPRVSITEAGLITQTGNQYDVFGTQLVTPSLGQYIGYRYTVTLPKDHRGKVDAKLARQNQFPVTVRMTHPEIIDPKTGKGFTTSSWTDTMFKHNRNLAMWYFGDKNELVTGRWTLELIYRDSVVARKSFMLVNMDEKPQLNSKQAKAVKQGLMLTKLVTQGEAVLCAETKYRTCLGFDSANSCEVNLSPFKDQCQQAALDFSKRQANKGSSADQLRGYFSHYTACMAKNYIKTTELTPQEVGDCLGK